VQFLRLLPYRLSHDAAGRCSHRLTELSETRSRSVKVAILADLLGRLDASEVAVAVGFLASVPGGAGLGVGYSRIYGIDCPGAREACLTVGDLDCVIAEVQAMTGSGSTTRREQILGEVLGRATSHEADCVGRLFTEGLRQRALVGLMVARSRRRRRSAGALARRVADAVGAIQCARLSTSVHGNAASRER
jgi:hypothetical protein